MRLAPFALVAATIAVAACGGDEPAAEAVQATAAPTLAPTTLPAVTTTTTIAPIELLNAGGVVVTAPPETLPESRTVAVIGDSLTVAATELIGVALGSIGTEVLTVDGIEGRRMTGGAVQPGVDAIDALVAAGTLPDVWVVALGTNDVGAEVAGEQAAAAAQAVLDRIPAGAPVVWVNAWIRDRAGDAALFNSVVKDVLEARGDMTIVDWYANGDDPGVISADGIHLTDIGEARFAASIAAGVITLVGR